MPNPAVPLSSTEAWWGLEARRSTSRPFSSYASGSLDSDQPGPRVGCIRWPEVPSRRPAPRDCRRPGQPSPSFGPRLVLAAEKCGCTCVELDHRNVSCEGNEAAPERSGSSYFEADDRRVSGRGASQVDRLLASGAIEESQKSGETRAEVGGLLPGRPVVQDSRDRRPILRPRPAHQRILLSAAGYDACQGQAAIGCSRLPLPDPDVFGILEVPTALEGLNREPRLAERPRCHRRDLDATVSP